MLTQNKKESSLNLVIPVVLEVIIIILLVLIQFNSISYSLTFYNTENNIQFIKSVNTYPFYLQSSNFFMILFLLLDLLLIIYSFVFDKTFFQETSKLHLKFILLLSAVFIAENLTFLITYIFQAFIFFGADSLLNRVSSTSATFSPGYFITAFGNILVIIFLIILEFFIIKNNNQLTDVAKTQKSQEIRFLSKALQMFFEIIFILVSFYLIFLITSFFTLLVLTTVFNFQVNLQLLAEFFYVLTLIILFFYIRSNIVESENSMELVNLLSNKFYSLKYTSFMPKFISRYLIIVCSILLSVLILDIPFYTFNEKYFYFSFSYPDFIFDFLVFIPLVVLSKSKNFGISGLLKRNPVLSKLNVKKGSYISLNILLIILVLFANGSFAYVLDQPFKYDNSVVEANLNTNANALTLKIETVRLPFSALGNADLVIDILRVNSIIVYSFFGLNGSIEILKMYPINTLQLESPSDHISVSNVDGNFTFHGLSRNEVFTIQVTSLSTISSLTSNYSYGLAYNGSSDFVSNIVL